MESRSCIMLQEHCLLKVPDEWNPAAASLETRANNLR